MPELPEVETVKQGLQNHIQKQIIQEVIIRQARLRWPIPATLPALLKSQLIVKIDRRAKYLLIRVTNGTLIIHLGMSGSLKLVAKETPLKRHDHVDILLQNKQILRYHDPRRFGSILWTEQDPAHHHLLNKLGPEPFSPEFTGKYLLQLALRRKISIKAYLMDSKIVVGVGNIYANEILYLCRISPFTMVNQLNLSQFDDIVDRVKQVLSLAIKLGGTTLKDFHNSEGKPGYFQQTLQVYGRANQPCLQCGELLSSRKQNQRTTTYCRLCQR